MNLVFDFGAVLFRFEPLAVVASIWPELARDEASATTLARRIFGPEWLQFDRGTVSEAELVPNLAHATRLDVPRIERLIAEVQQALLPMPDSVVLLPRLKVRGHRLFFLSNMPASFAQALDPDGLVLPQFEDGIYSSQVQLVKPEAAIFHAAERRFGIQPIETLFIDDQPLNVSAAQACGWEAFRFVDAAQCEGELRRRKLLD